MFNLFFKFNKEYIHKKIVIQNLNILEDKSEKYTKGCKNSISLGQILLDKGEIVQNRQLQIHDKENEFLGFIFRDWNYVKRRLENFLVILI